MLWLKAVLLWLAIVPLAIVNGALRERFLLPRFGARAARPLSGVSLSLLVFLFTLATIPWLEASSPRAYLAVGGLWLALTIAFEFLFGRLVSKKSWRELLRPYFFRDGDLWVLVLVVVFLSPMLAAKLRGAEPTAPRTAAALLSVRHEAGQFVLFAAPGDEQALRDIAAALQQHAPDVCRTLHCDYRRTVVVEVFPDQASMDRAQPEASTRGHFAHSDERGIQIVSPRNEIPHLPVSYETRVLIAVHEFAHLVNNAINPAMPSWLNEGAAVFAAPHAPYTHVCQHQFPFDRIPAFADLRRDYRSVPAADLFAFTVVEFIATEFGLDALNRLLRAPDALERIVGLTDAQFEERWHQFLQQHYVHP